MSEYKSSVLKRSTDHNCRCSICRFVDGCFNVPVLLETIEILDNKCSKLEKTLEMLSATAAFNRRYFNQITTPPLLKGGE